MNYKHLVLCIMDGYGIREDRALKYDYSKQGVSSCYEAMSHVLYCRRDNASLDGSNWKDKVKEDENK